MPDYSKGKIYKIECNETGEVYYGSTTQKYLSERMSGHRCAYRKWLKGKVRKCQSYDIIERGNYSYSLVEDYPCERKEQLLSRERWFIQNNECVNKVFPATSLVKEYIQEYQRKWREENKEQIAEKKKEYYNENKEKIAEKRKEYYNENKERIADYREDNKEKISEKRSEKIRCECCDCEVKRHSWSAHTKTKKHQANSK